MGVVGVRGTQKLGSESNRDAVIHMRYVQSGEGSMIAVPLILNE